MMKTLKLKTTTLKISGMSCAACVGHVTRALQALDGVQSAEVRLADGQATVTYDPTQVQISQLQEAVVGEGYEATR